MKERKPVLAVMNSAMMPTDGTYRKQSMAPEGAKHFFDAHKQQCAVTSYLGYPNVLVIANTLLNTDLGLSRESMQFVSGDIAICFQLLYRVQTPAEKASNQHGSKLEDYNISIVRFTE